MYSRGEVWRANKAEKAFKENIIKEYKPALISYAWILVLGGILLFARGLGILFIAGAIMHRNSIKYTITDRRIKAKTGFGGGNTAEIGLPHIDNISLRQNFAARICGYGDLLVGAAGRTEYKVIIKNIRHPRKIMMLIDNLRTGSSGNIAHIFYTRDEKPGKYQECGREDIADWRVAGVLIILGIIAFALFLSSLILLLPW